MICGVSNAFRKSTKISDAVMFVTLPVSITHLSAITYWLQTAKEDFVEQFCALACFCDSSLIIKCSWIALLWYRNDHAFLPIARNRVFNLQCFGVAVQHVRDFSLQLGYLQNTIRNIVEAGRCVITRRPWCCQIFCGSKCSGLLIAIYLLPLLRVKKAILQLLLIVLTIEDSRVVVR